MITTASPFLVVEDVEASIQYYQSLFGGEVKILNEHQGVLRHAELHIGSSLLHFSSTYGGHVPKGHSIKVILNIDSEADMRRIYDRLVADHGQATVPLQDTFFGALHGEVTDAINGINWVMNHFRQQA